MTPGWVARYLNIPFQERGRSLDGLDCYGLIRQIYQDQRSIELPSYVEDYTTTTDIEEIRAIYRNAMAAHWTEIPIAQARLFDVAILRILGQPVHFGLVLEAPWFLHIREGIWSRIERWDSIMWSRRLVTMARWNA